MQGQCKVFKPMSGNITKGIAFLRKWIHTARCTSFLGTCIGILTQPFQTFIGIAQFFPCWVTTHSYDPSIKFNNPNKNPNNLVKSLELPMFTYAYWLKPGKTPSPEFLTASILSPTAIPWAAPAKPPALSSQELLALSSQAVLAPGESTHSSWQTNPINGSK